MAIIEKLLEYLNTFKPILPNLSNISGVASFGSGWLFGAFGAVALSLYGLSMGRTRAVLSLLSIYVAFVVIQLFPYLDKVDRIIDKPLEIHWLKIGVFLAAYVVIFIIFNFSFIRKRLSSAEFSLFGVILISLLQLGFLTSIIFSFLPEELVNKWSFSFYNYFGTQQALFAWAIVPLPVLLFLKNK